MLLAEDIPAFLSSKGFQFEVFESVTTDDRFVELTCDGNAVVVAEQLAPYGREFVAASFVAAFAVSIQSLAIQLPGVTDRELCASRRWFSWARSSIRRQSQMLRSVEVVVRLRYGVIRYKPVAPSQVGRLHVHRTVIGGQNGPTNFPPLTVGIVLPAGFHLPSDDLPTIVGLVFDGCLLPPRSRAPYKRFRSGVNDDCEARRVRREAIHPRVLAFRRADALAALGLARNGFLDSYPKIVAIGHFTEIRSQIGNRTDELVAKIQISGQYGLIGCNRGDHIIDAIVKPILVSWWQCDIERAN